MRLVLTLDNRRGTGARETRTLGQGTISIGRAAGNDWVLADPDRHLSKTHCMVSAEGGRFVLTDLSTNGVFVNGARDPVGREGKVVLTDGDEFRLGDYSVTVTELPGEVAAAPRASASFGNSPSDPFGGAPLGGAPLGNAPLGNDWLDDPFAEHPPAQATPFQHPVAHTPPQLRPVDPFDLVDENRRRPPSLDDDLFAGATPSDPWIGPSQRDNVDAPFQAIAAPRVIAPANLDDFDFDALLGDLPPGTPEPQTPEPVQAAPAQPAPIQPPPVRPTPAPHVAVAAHAAAVPDAAPAATNAGDASAALNAFLEGAGVPELRVGAHDPEAALRAAGALMRVMVEGLREVLMSRSAIKNELRVEQTMLRARDNNALKFSVTVDEAVAALLMPERPGYKPPLDAAREAFGDVRSHEMAVMAGVQTALIGLLKRFDPVALEKRLQPGMLDNFLPGARKSRYWELFCTTYADIAREAEDDFQSVFGREFARAYDAQVRKS
jgi:type VI secretion system protein